MAAERIHVEPVMMSFKMDPPCSHFIPSPAERKECGKRLGQGDIHSGFGRAGNTALLCLKENCGMESLLKGESPWWQVDRHDLTVSPFPCYNTDELVRLFSAEECVSTTRPRAHIANTEKCFGPHNARP
jgi:hypothetical protein